MSVGSANIKKIATLKKSPDDLPKEISGTQK